MKKQTKKQAKSKKGQASKWRLTKKQWLFGALALLLAAALVVGGILLLTRPPVVYAYEGVSVRQPLYDYWTACYKYAYLVSRKDLGISDTPAGWQEVGEDGRTYQALFYEEIEGAVCRRIVAAALFDKAGLSLSSSVYATISDIVEGFGYYDEETPLQDLKEDYGISKRQILQIGVMEAKYAALQKHLFGEDLKGVYGEAYKEICQRRYEETCTRVRFIYIPNDKPEEMAALEAAMADDELSEATFAQLQIDYNHLPISMEKYPDGYYFCSALANPTQGFDNGLQKAIAALEKVGDKASEENESKTGRYYAYRCELQEEGYLKQEIPGFAASIANEAYYAYLNGHTAAITRGKGTPISLVADIKACREYNMVWELANK